ncbi:MAG TPA: sigma-70 family RNA polymerase sigma factor [Vitreimonas sp.]|uniref:RNA polymerase sigma factor n=1 Tax=Vitreimonas sp. TaxID=3069702 RepID=UPI002D2A46D4|nr:sigma-70 family RNA polymerase sigma factor [Vitreimonas sp.]HYD88696.1 sigma-70 family RNA polymerase sigma factor [Vitreimonas sp.]
MSADHACRGDGEMRTTVLLAIAGSDEAFAGLVRQHQAAIVGLLTRVCGDAGTAEDVAQAAFLKAWRNIRALRDADRFAAWLRQIALRAAVDASRTRMRAEPLAETDTLVDPAGRDADARLDLDAALARLSPAQRACVLLAHGEGMTHAEVAAELNMPVGTVKSHVARASRLLRRMLEEEA